MGLPRVTNDVNTTPVSTDEDLARCAGNLYDRAPWLYVFLILMGIAPGAIAAMNGTDSMTLLYIFGAFVGGIIGGVLADILVNYFRLQALRSRKLTE